MPNKFFVLIFFLICVIFSGVSAQENRYPGADYLWPTNASEYMSATFGETRAAHFHAAVDIGTWGREGYDVYASRDGLLYRIGVSPYGYGKVVYLQHRDGTFSLYAHMQDFSPEIREIVDELQFENYRYSIDKVIADRDIHISRGTVIGRSGSTGIGPPHLHFELRTPSNHPFNPKLAGLHVPDTTPPFFSGLAVEPISADALINGKKEIYTRRPRTTSSVYDFGTIPVSGTVGLAVNVSDRSDNARNVYAVYELELEIDGQNYFYSRADSFSYDHSRKMLVDRVWPLLSARQGAFQRLHIKDGNDLEFYVSSYNQGRIRLDPGKHPFRVLARDYYGNESVATGILDVSANDNGIARPVFKPASEYYGVSESDPDFTQTQTIQALTWNKGWFSPKSITLNNLKIIPYRALLRMARSFDEVRPGESVQLFDPVFDIVSDELPKTRVFRAIPERDLVARIPDIGVKLHAPAGAVFDTLYVSVSGQSDAETPVYHILPAKDPFRRPVNLTVELDEKWFENPEQVSFYTFNSRRNSYNPVSTTRDPESRTITGRISEPGTFYVRRDTLGPEISSPQLFRRRSDQRWFISVNVKDDNSGIDFNNSEFIVNGVRGIPAYDPFGGVMRYYHPEFEPRSENEASVIIRDYAGNETEYSFVIRR